MLRKTWLLVNKTSCKQSMVNGSVQVVCFQSYWQSQPHPPIMWPHFEQLGTSSPLWVFAASLSHMIAICGVFCGFPAFFISGKYHPFKKIHLMATTKNVGKSVLDTWCLELQQQQLMTLIGPRIISQELPVLQASYKNQ